MKNIKSLLTAAALVATASMTAQNLQSGYFTDGFLYRHTMNPAFGNENNYVSMPILGNMNINLQGNIGVSDVFKPRNGRLVTIFHPEVSVSDALSGIHNRNRLSQDLKIGIMSAGFKAFGGYNTIELNLRESAYMSVPGNVIGMAKEGITNDTYDLGAMGASAQALIELGLGHSRQIDDQWRVGGKIKFLFGAGNVDADFNNTKIVLGTDGKYQVSVDGMVQANVKGATFKEKYMSEQEIEHEFDKLEIDGPGLSGFGLAFDLGAEFKLDDNWKFSAAFLDLGFVSWNTNVTAAARGTFDYDKYGYNVDDDKFCNLETGADIGDDFEKIYKLRVENPSGGSRTTGLAATMQLGAEYTTPFYDKLKFGLMNTTRIYGKYSWTDFRLSANVAPSKIFSATINFGIGSYGPSFGWLLSLHPKGFNLFLGMDRTLGKLSKQGIPLGSNAGFSMGINFPF